MNGLLLVRRQVVTWTNALRINSIEIRIKIQKFSFTKMQLNVSPAKWSPFCPGGDESESHLHNYRLVCSSFNTLIPPATIVLWNALHDPIKPQCFSTCYIYKFTGVRHVISYVHIGNVLDLQRGIISSVSHTIPCVIRAVVRNHRHDDVIKWKHFPRCWPFVRGIHRSPVNSPHKGQWRGALMFSLICTWLNGWINIGEAGDLRRIAPIMTSL